MHRNGPVNPYAKTGISRHLVFTPCRQPILNISSWPIQPVWVASNILHIICLNITLTYYICWTCSSSFNVIDTLEQEQDFTSGLNRLQIKIISIFIPSPLILRLDRWQMRAWFFFAGLRPLIIMFKINARYLFWSFFSHVFSRLTWYTNYFPLWTLGGYAEVIFAVDGLEAFSRSTGHLSFLFLCHSTSLLPVSTGWIRGSFLIALITLAVEVFRVSWVWVKTAPIVWGSPQLSISYVLSVLGRYHRPFFLSESFYTNTLY